MSDASIVGSGVRPPPFLFYPTLFIKAPLILKIPDPHPYVSYIHFWCHGNVVDWHPIALLIYHFTCFQPEDIPIFSILFCKYKCTTWNLEVWRTPPFIVCFHPLYQSTLFSGKMWTPTLLQFFKISNPHPLKCVDCPLHVWTLQLVSKLSLCTASSAFILVAGVWMRLLNIWTISTVIVESGILFQAEMVLG